MFHIKNRKPRNYFRNMIFTKSNHLIYYYLTYSRTNENESTDLLMNFITPREAHNKQIHFSLAIISDVFC